MKNIAVFTAGTFTALATSEYWGGKVGVVVGIFVYLTLTIIVNRRVK